MFFWSSFLTKTDAYFTPYLFITVLAFVCFYNNSPKKEKSRTIKTIGSICSGLFSLMVLAANYPLVFEISYPGTIFRKTIIPCLIIILLGGGYCVAWNILYFLANKLKNFYWKKHLYRISSKAVFCISFFSISIMNIFLLLTCKYPGNLSPDSISLIEQIMLGRYSNHHPFYYTMLIKIFVEMGLNIFGELNAAIAFFHIMQIIFMAGCFSIATMTLYDENISIYIVIIIYGFYFLMPFHIMYSFTMWKDVMFGGFVLLFLVSVYRVLNNVGENGLFNWIVLGSSGLGICLFRSNGFFAFIITVIAFSILFWKMKRIVCFLFFVIAIGFFMKHTALESIGVTQPDIVETLSIPLQQVSRVIVEHNDFSDSQRKLLYDVVNIESIPEVYQSYISDPVKNLIRNTGNEQCIQEHKLAYLKLYLEVGLKHPASYIKAWIDETKGFWNAGYSYWRWADGVYENEFGISRVVYSEFINKCLNDYLWIFSEISFFQLFLSIGVYVWIVLFLCFICIVRRDRIGVFMSIPILAIIFSLIISTPVYSEFRYAYSAFCSVPFLIVVAFIKNKN